MAIKYGVIVFGLYFVDLSNSWGQNDTVYSKSIQLVKADRMDVITINGKEINKFKGNVVFKHYETFVYCDSAYQFPKDKQKGIEAFGQIKIVQSDSILLSGNHLLYNANSQKATMKGNVILKRNNKVKKRNFLKYSLK